MSVVLMLAIVERRKKKEGKRREARVTQEFAAVLEGQITYLSLLVSIRPVNTAALSHACPRPKSCITPQNRTKQRTVHVLNEKKEKEENSLYVLSLCNIQQGEEFWGC